MSRLAFSAFWMLFCLSPACLMVVDAIAAECVITPFVRFRETYNDNVFFKNVADFEHVISPGSNFSITQGKMSGFLRTLDQSPGQAQESSE